MKAMIVGMVCLMTAAMVHAEDVRNDVAVKVWELEAFKTECSAAKNASTLDSLQKAITSMQELSVTIELSGSNSVYAEYLASLNEKLAALSKVTTTSTTISSEFRDALRTSKDAIAKFSMDLDLSMESTGLRLKSYHEMKDALENQKSQLNNYGICQKSEPINEGPEVLNNRSRLYAAVLLDVETRRKMVISKMPKLEGSEKKVKDAKASPMPSPEQVLNVVLFSKDPPSNLEVEGWVTRGGVNTVQKLHNSESDLLAKLKRAVVVGGRTAEKTNCPNRLELILSAPELGKEVATIFFLEGNRIKFHGIWIDGRYI
jgi:hypothetical protein